VELAQIEIHIANGSGTVPRQVASVWVASRFVNVSGEKEEAIRRAMSFYGGGGRAVKRSNGSAMSRPTSRSSRMPTAAIIESSVASEVGL
jgi:hypothetical protein